MQGGPNEFAPRKRLSAAGNRYGPSRSHSDERGTPTQSIRSKDVDQLSLASPEAVTDSFCTYAVQLEANVEKRGDLRWARLRNEGGRRPVLLVSRGEAYRVLDWIIVIPISRTVRERDDLRVAVT